MEAQSKAPEAQSDTAKATAGKGFAALRVPAYRLYIAGSACSRIGDNMESVTRSWLVWQLTGDARWLGIMTFCHWLPTTLLSLFAGVLADRLNNRKVIMFAEGLFLTSSVSVGLLTVTGLVNVYEIAGLLLVHGVASAVGNPSRQVFVHDIVGKEKLMSAVSLNSSLFQCMQFVGPAIAGTLIAVLGIGPAYMINSIAFVPAIFTLAMIRVEKKHREPSGVSPWQNLIEGFRYVGSNRVLLSFLALAILPALLVSDSISAMIPVFATEILKVGPQGMGFLLSANGFGAISAALIISYMGGIRKRGKFILFTSLGYAMLLVAFSFSSWFIVSVLILVGVGMAMVASSTIITTSLQLAASDKLRGRVMGVYLMGTQGIRTFNGLLLGSFIVAMGTVVAPAGASTATAAAAGAPLAMAALSGLVTIGVIVITFLWPEGRKVD